MTEQIKLNIEWDKERQLTAGEVDRRLGMHDYMWVLGEEGMVNLRMGSVGYRDRPVLAIAWHQEDGKYKVELVEPVKPEIPEVREACRTAAGDIFEGENGRLYWFTGGVWYCWIVGDRSIHTPFIVGGAPTQTIVRHGKIVGSER